ncbi:heme-binding protein, partial [Corallococcus sp. AB049A]
MGAIVTDGILLPDTGFTQTLRLCTTTTKENAMKTKPCLCQDDVTK